MAHFGLPVVPATPRRGTVAAARFAVFFTGSAWLAYVVEQAIRLQRSGVTPQSLAESIAYLLLVTLLTASASAYLISRLGYFERARTHRRIPRSTIDDFFDEGMPPITVIIPSYREDRRVVRQTLLSAALQEYANLRVVLLIDDPPNARDPEQQLALRRARALPGFISELLREPRREFEAALATFDAEPTRGQHASGESLERLACNYDRAVAWLDREITRAPRVDHIDQFLVHDFLDRLANDFRTTADAVRAAALEPSATISRRRVRQLYARLVRTFEAEITSFERKQFASLSHEANKAMNLNSYLGLMGGRYAIVPSPGGRVLIPASNAGPPDLVVPNSDYVLTLDADSILLPEYCLRLAYFMEQPENNDVAVVQTPYSSYRGADSEIERIAGATTDIQHIAHQGLTQHEATFWVGANAVIRKRALDELKEEEEESGFLVARYIRDRTVIEDTESSIDLRAKGWRLHNYPERLSYSATPPDFGSLVIQRQRWANGGLVILPKLLRLLIKSDQGVVRPRFWEIFLRTNYLASISWSSIGLLLLLFYPFDGALLSRFAVLTALPYFWTMAQDLKREGYRRRDIFKVYGFNLLLLPVNLAGTIQSIVQTIGGQKMAFARTPKVQNRTVAPLLFLLMPLLLIAWSGRTLLDDISDRAYIHGTFAAANLLMTAYALVVFVGVRNIGVDIVINIRGFLYKAPKPQLAATAQVPHWASVLYVGSSIPEEIVRSGPLAVALAAQDRFKTNRGAGRRTARRLPAQKPTENGHVDGVASSNLAVVEAR